MQLLYRMILSTLLICLVTSCVNKSSYKKLIREDGKSQKILVVSSMGDEFQAKFIGFTIFTNKHETIDVTKWDIDSEIENKIANLKLNANFEISAIDLKEIKSKYPVIGYDSFLSKSKFNGLDKEIYALAKENGFDLVMFVQTFSATDSVFFTGVPVSGYGLYNRSFSPFSKLYATSLISLHDVKSGKKIINLPAQAHSQVSNKYRNDKVKEVDFERIKEQKDIIINLILKGVKERMQWVKIIPSEIID